MNSRHFPNIDRHHHLIQVRNPRDILVSQYYSFGWSHPSGFFTPEKHACREYIRTRTIDEYVLENCAGPDRFKTWAPLKSRYRKILGRFQSADPHLTVLRYEDMIKHFPRWFEAAISPFGIEPGSAGMGELLAMAEDQLRIEGENPAHHKRRVIPGDHRRKLRPATIEKLNEVFWDEMDELGYRR